MAFNGSFGDGEIDVEEEEFNLNDFAKMKEKEDSIDNTPKHRKTDTVHENNDIFNSIFASEIDSNNNQNKIEFLQILLIQEKIKYSLLNIFRILKNHMNKHKIFFIYRLKFIFNKKYSNLIEAEILCMNIKTNLDHLFYMFQFIKTKKIKKCFNKIKNYSLLKKRQEEAEQQIKKEKENKIQSLNNKLNLIGNSLNEVKGKLNILNNIQKKLSNENKELKNKINQLNEKLAQLIKTGNSLKESISSKKNKINSGLNKNQENIIQNLQNLIEQKENEKERAMIDVDNFYQSMDVVLSQYESISETILSNCNINDNK